MVNSTLFQLLNALNSNEFRDLGEYIRSDYFNKNESVIKLYDYLKLFHPDFSGMNFEKELVYNKLFPNVKYDDAFMRKLMFNLSKLAEDYLAYRNFTTNKFKYYDCLLKELELRNADRLFQKKLKIYETEFDKLKFKDTEYYEIKSKLDTFKNFIFLKTANFVNLKDKPGEIVIREIESKINFYLISIIDWYRFFFNFRKMLRYDLEPESEFYKEIINYLRKHEQLHKTPLLSLYFNSLLLLIENDERYYQKVKSILINELDNFSYLDKYTTMALLVNFATDEYHKGKKNFLKERHELHKLILKNNLISPLRPGGFFNDVLFKNIVTVGLLLKETDWTEDFINKYIDRIDPGEKNNVLYLSNARLNFKKKNYEKSLEELSKIISVGHFYFKLSIKSLTLMIYIEKGWFVQAYDVIDAFRHYLSQEKMLPGFRKEKYINFLKYCNEIIKLNSKKSSDKANILKLELLNAENVLEKEWLMEKVINFKS